MSCRSVSHLLPLFDDPELASQERESVAAHVARCEACAAELEAIRSARQQLTGWRDVRVPAGGPQRVMAKVYAATPARRRLPFLAPQWAGLLAACAVAVVLWITWPPAAPWCPKLRKALMVPPCCSRLPTRRRHRTPCGAWPRRRRVRAGPSRVRTADPSLFVAQLVAKLAEEAPGVRPDVQPAGDGGLLVQFERLRRVLHGVLVGLNEADGPGSDYNGRLLALVDTETERTLLLTVARTAFSLNCTALALLEPV